MALTKMNFLIEAKGPARGLKDWSHTGVVGSGDLEIMMERKDLEGRTAVKVVTPVKGFETVWERVLTKFISEEEMGDMSIEINDNNATPFVVALRLRQALLEAGREDDGGR